MNAGDVVSRDIFQMVEQSGLLSKKENFILLCSGGRDSVCLFDVMNQLLPQGAFSVLHVNYGLRKQADQDERFVKQLCERLGIRCLIHNAIRTSQTGNLQAWARKQRYEIAQKHARRNQAKVVTAHTATDQLETFLYRLCVSPGRRALLAMQAQSENLVRPLLAVTREQVTRYCQERQLQWRDDETNEDEGYLRNRIRHQLLPVLKEIHPLAEQNILRTIDLNREEASVLDQLVNDFIARRDEIPVQELQELPRSLARLVVRKLAENATGRLSPRAANRLDELFTLSHGKLDLGEGARAVIASGNLSFQKTPEILRHTTTEQ